MNPAALADTPQVAGTLPRSIAGAATRSPAAATETGVPIATAAATPPARLEVPSGFAVSVFAEAIGADAVPQGGAADLRFMAYAPNGDLFVTAPKLDRIFLFPDRDRNGAADAVRVFAEGAGLNKPHGIAFRGPWLYVANTDRVIRYPYHPGAIRARETPETVIDNLPGGEQHWTRTIVFGPDERLYLSVGASCNLCEEPNPLRAAILRFLPDGSEAVRTAIGLRNAVGLAFNPDTEALWATENGRDELGDDLPPDEINLIAPGGDYGWPYCFGDRRPDPGLGGDASRCAGTLPATIELPAHSAPLGITFYRGAAFPEAYRGDAFVAYHGSWNRSFPTGYKVVRIPFEDGEPAGPPEDFVSGWLMPDTQRWGRPVDVISAPDGSLMMSDDAGGRIYRVFYAPVQPTPTRWH